MAKYIQLKDRLTGEKEYPITSSAAILMKNGVGNLDDMILNAGKVKDVKVDGTSVVDANGIANIDIPQSITIDDSTNTITVGDKTIANILTKADLDDDIKDSANEAVKAATAHAVEDLVGKLEDLDVDADGAKDTPAPSNIVAAINDVAKNAGKIDKILANGTELTITDKKVDIPAATKDAYGLVKVDEALSDSSTNAVTNKAITSNTGLVSAVTENAAKSDGTATGTAPKDLAEAINNVAKNAGAISKVATTDGELTITDKKVTIPDATGTVKGLVNTTDAYDGTNGTKAATGKSIKAALETLDVTEVGEAGKYIQKLKQEDGKITATLADVKSTYTATDLEPISGKGVKAALDTLDVAEVGQAGKYIQKIKQEDGKIVATLADVKDTYTATDTEPISGKGVADMLEDLKLEETGGTDKIITMVKQEDGKVTATAKTAVEKVATPATTNAYEYKIADASVKVELPKATDAAYGEILLDKLKIDSASTAKTDDPKLMTGKAIEDSLAVKKVNGNASIYAYNATVPTVDNAIALGAGASVTAAGGVAVGAGAATASADDVAIGSGASTASDGSIAIGKSSTTNGAATIAIGETAVVAGQSAMAIGKGASAESTNAITIGTAAQAQKEGDIAIGTDTITDGKYAVAIGSDAYAEGESAVSIGKEANTTNKQAIAIGKTSATGKKSISIGNNNFATYEGAVAIGDTVRADNSWETALGTYNRSVEDDDPVVGTALTVGRGYPIDGDDPVLYNLLEQKQNADLYIPGIGGFDGKNSDPYDYELDEDGNPKINNDGNPIKKVRPLQESIVEDVVYMKPKPKEVITLTSEEWSEVQLMNGGSWPYVQVIEIPGGLPSTMPEPIKVNAPGSAGQSAPCSYGMLLTVPADNPMDLDAGKYFYKGYEAGCVYFAPNGDATIPFCPDMTPDEYQGLMEDVSELGLTGNLCVVGGNNEVDTGVFTTTIGQSGGGSGGSTAYHGPAEKIEANGHEYIGKWFKGSDFRLDTPLTFTVESDEDDCCYPMLLMFAPDGSFLDGVELFDEPPFYPLSFDIEDWTSWEDAYSEFSQLTLAFAIIGADYASTWNEAIAANVIIDSPYGATPEPEPEELIEVSIVKEHKGTLPFIDKIKSDSDDYDVPNVKAVKKVRKEIEDEFVFVEGSGDKSIKSKFSASANGAYSFAWGLRAIANGEDSVAIGVDAETTEDAYQSMAMGTGASTMGPNSIAIGVQAEATGNGATAIMHGYASGDDSFAVYGNATADKALAINGTAAGKNSIAVGVKTSANGESSIAIGYDSNTTKSKSIAIGYGAHASKDVGEDGSDESIAIGALTHAKGHCSVAIGSGIVASNENSIAIGNLAASNNTDAIAIGHNTKAAGISSIAIGTIKHGDFTETTEAAGYESIAIGIGAKTKKLYGVSFGNGTITHGEEGVAIGCGTEAPQYSVAIGSYGLRPYSRDLQNTLQDCIVIGASHPNNNSQILLGVDAMSHTVDGDDTPRANRKLDSPDNTHFAVASAMDHYADPKNAFEIMQNGDTYISNLGDYDGTNVDSTNIKKNADGTDYINPLTNKTEKIVKPLQDIIELMDARIKYLEDIIDQLTQQRNPVEP